MTTDARPPGTPQRPPHAPESEPAEKSAPIPRQPAPGDAAARLRSALDLVDPGPVLPNTPLPPRSSPIPPAPAVPRPPEIPPLPVGPPKPLLPPEPLSDETGPLRPVPARRPGRVAAAAICVVLGAGLIGGAAAGTWLDGGSEPARPSNFTAARDLWHSTPVDTLFPPTIRGTGAGPGGADREWTRVGVAPDSGCAGALDPLLLKVLEPVGCARMVRATYTDATASSVITVGLVFTQAEPAAMAALANRFTTEKLAERSDLMPRAYPVKATDAAAFGDQQRASWTVRVLTDAPVVVTAVSGFADGRRIDAPQSAEQATADGASGPVAEAGLGQDAKGIADNVERGLRKKAAASPEPAS